MSIDVDRERLARNLDAIVGERSPLAGRQHLALVEAFVEQEFATHGLKVESDFFRYGEQTFRNVIGRYGPERNMPLIIVGAHFDSVVDTPGADDNASGVAVFLEGGRPLTPTPPQARGLFFA